MHLPSPTTSDRLTCTSETCSAGCALEVIDGLLRATGTVRGEEVDALLDLRWLLRQRQDAEGSVSLFCKLRRSMEERHYLAFYRLRRWLGNHIQAKVRLNPAATEQLISISPDWYCVEAIRHHCLRSATSMAERLATPRVQFTFRSLQGEAKQPFACIENA